MACMVNCEDHLTTIEKSPSQLELVLLVEIETKKVNLSLMDDMNVNVFSNTKSDPPKIENELLRTVVDWYVLLVHYIIFIIVKMIDIFFIYRKTTFENFYRQSPVFKDQLIQVDNFKHINVQSNPKYWSTKDVHDYLSHDEYCIDIKKGLFDVVNDIKY